MSDSVSEAMLRSAGKDPVFPSLHELASFVRKRVGSQPKTRTPAVVTRSDGRRRWHSLAGLRHHGFPRNVLLVFGAPAPLR